MARVAAKASRLYSAAGRQADLFLAIALMAVSANFRSLLSSPTPSWQLNFLDHSWAYDFAVKAQQHIWLGDRVTFTYGPLFQLLSGAIVNTLGGSLGAYLRSSHLLHFWAGIILTFLTGRLLLAGHSSWKRSFYLLALVGFWGALDLRFCFDLFAFALALRYFDRLGESRIVRVKSALAMALVMFAGFLISADTGIYSVGAFAIAGVAHFLVKRRDPPARKIAMVGVATVGCGFLILAVVAAAMMPHTRFGFWLNSLDIVSQYRWSLAFPMDKPVKWRLIAASAVCLSVLMIGYRWRDSLSNSLVRRPAFFVAAIGFSLLTLQSSIVRAHWGHVFLALLPSVALAGAVLMGGTPTENGWRGGLPLIVAFALTAAFTAPIWWLQPRNIVDGFKISTAQSHGCPPGMFYIDDACLTRRDYQPLKTVSEYLRAHASEAEAVAVFPFENLYADVARRRVAGGVLQNYQIAGERLIRRQLEGLERDQPRLAVFSADGLASSRVDDVPNLTRTPDVWFYLQSRFAKQAELAPGIAILMRDSTRLQRWQTDVVRAGEPSQSKIQLKQAIPVDLRHWPVESDLLRLRLRVSYPFWWRVTKPASFSVIIGLADHSEKVVRAVLPPNESADLWIYPWNESHLLRYFEEDQRLWQSGRPRAPVSSIALRFERVDWLSTTPTQVNVYGVEGVHLRLKPPN